MLLVPQVFGKEHLIFLAVFLTVAIVATVLAKLYLKSEKSQWIYMRIMAALVLLFNILNRVGVGLDGGGFLFALPNTYCSLTSFILPIVVLFGKKNLYCYNCLWYMALVGGLATIIYPDFIVQAETIWHLNTIFSLLHHGTIFFLVITMGMFKVFRPSIKRSWVFPLGFCLYIVVGTFEIHFLKLEEAMCIVQPLLSGTPLNCWFILAVGTALVYIASILYEYTPKLIKKIKEKKETK